MPRGTGSNPAAYVVLNGNVFFPSIQHINYCRTIILKCLSLVHISTDSDCGYPILVYTPYKYSTIS